MEVLASGESSQKKGRKKEPGRSGKKSTSGKTSTTAFSLPGPCCSSSLLFARGPRALSLFLLFLLFALSSPPFFPSLRTFFLSPPSRCSFSHLLFTLSLPSSSPSSFLFLPLRLFLFFFLFPLPSNSQRSPKLPPLATVQAHFNGGFEFMSTSLQALCDASGALRGGDPASPAVGRAIIGAIRACAQSSHGAHHAAWAVERALAESELRHSQGTQFLVANLVDPVIAKVGGPVAAAVVKCCLPGVGPELQLQDEQQEALDDGRRHGTADFRDHGVDQVGDQNLAAAPELVPGAVLSRLAELVKGMNATMSSLPELEQRYLKAYEVAQKMSVEVIKSADALSQRAAATAAAAAAAAAAATSPEAAAAAFSPSAASSAAAAAASADAPRGRQNAEIGSLPDLLDKCNDDFNRFFQQVDEELLTKLRRSMGNVAGAATARTRKAHRALSASMDRHRAKELRDAMMLRALRRIADAGQGGSDGSGSSAAAALAAVLDGYDRAAKEQHERLAAAQRRCAPPPTAAAAAAAAAAAPTAASPAPAAAPARHAASVAGRRRNNHRNGNANGGSGDVRPAQAVPLASTPVAPASSPASFSPLYELFFGHWCG